MMVAPVVAGTVFHSGTPTKLFSNPEFSTDTYHREWDISADDKRFIMVQSPMTNASALGIVLNWGDEIAKLSGAGSH
jgi:hypothetical protein